MASSIIPSSVQSHYELSCQGSPELLVRWLLWGDFVQFLICCPYCCQRFFLLRCWMPKFCCSSCWISINFTIYRRFDYENRPKTWGLDYWRSEYWILCWLEGQLLVGEMDYWTAFEWDMRVVEEEILGEIAEEPEKPEEFEGRSESEVLQKLVVSAESFGMPK